MKILRFVCLLSVMVCLSFSGPGWAQGSTAAPAGGKPGQGPAGIWDKPDNPDGSELRGRIVYINRLTSQIIVAGEDNVKRSVRISALQMRRLRVGQSVDISLRGGGASAGSIRTNRNPYGLRPWRNR
jgi:hypothetical protein